MMPVPGMVQLLVDRGWLEKALAGQDAYGRTIPATIEIDRVWQDPLMPDVVMLTFRSEELDFVRDVGVPISTIWKLKGTPWWIEDRADRD